jgi:hypothetical protein
MTVNVRLGRLAGKGAAVPVVSYSLPGKSPLAHPIERRYNDPAPQILNPDLLIPAQMTFVISRCFSSPNPPFPALASSFIKATATKGSRA